MKMVCIHNTSKKLNEDDLSKSVTIGKTYEGEVEIINGNKYAFKFINDNGVSSCVFFYRFLTEEEYKKIQHNEEFNKKIDEILT